MKFFKLLKCFIFGHKGIETGHKGLILTEYKCEVCHSYLITNIDVPNVVLRLDNESRKEFYILSN